MIIPEPRFPSVNIALDRLEQAELESRAWIALVERGVTEHWRSIALLQWEADDGNLRARELLELLKVEVIRQRMLK